MSRFRLISDEAGYGLQDTFSNLKPLRITFNAADRIRRLEQAGKKNELIARAVKAREKLKVLDCTAGLGTDALILARLGCQVTLLERSPVMATLLQDAIDRASRDPRLLDVVARMDLVVADAISFLKSLAQPIPTPEGSDGLARYDVIYVDPMFPAKSGSAAVNGDMQQMQRFLGTDGDAATLLSTALETTCARIVLKRPPQSGWESPLPPTHVFSNRNSRYEVFVR